MIDAIKDVLFGFFIGWGGMQALVRSNCISGVGYFLGAIAAWAIYFGFLAK